MTGWYIQTEEQYAPIYMEVDDLGGICVGVEPPEPLSGADPHRFPLLVTDKRRCHQFIKE